MKKHVLKWISLLLAMTMLCMTLVACGDDGKCEACNGTGYYNAVNCPMCHGTGYSDFDMSDIPVY